MRANTRCYGSLEGMPPNPGRSKKAFRGKLVKTRQIKHQMRSVSGVLQMEGQQNLLESSHEVSRPEGGKSIM